jgi:predicted nucleic acid-binding protein
MSWCFTDEASPQADALLDRLRDHGAIAPALWRWEVSNVLLNGLRRGRVTASDIAIRFAFLEAMAISIDADATDRAWRETMLLAQTEALTVYDAAYLELALRTGLDLATLDGDLIRAAANLGVRAIP